MIDLQFLIFFLLCILQPICLPVPEATTILSGTLTIGANQAFAIGLIGILLGILTMYKITSYLSKKFLRNFKKNQHYKTYQKMMQSILKIKPLQITNQTLELPHTIKIKITKTT